MRLEIFFGFSVDRDHNVTKIPIHAKAELNRRKDQYHKQRRVYIILQATYYEYMRKIYVRQRKIFQRSNYCIIIWRDDSISFEGQKLL